MIPLELVHRLADLGVEALTVPLDESETTRRLFLELDDLWSKFLEARQLEVKKCPHALLEPKAGGGKRCAACHWPIRELSLPERVEVEKIPSILPEFTVTQTIRIIPMVCAECGLAPLTEAPGLSFQPELERWVCFDCGHRG